MNLNRKEFKTFPYLFLNRELNLLIESEINMPRSELEEKVRDYAVDEGILGKNLPHDDKIEFGYELNFPPNSPNPMKIIVLKLKDRKALAFQLATQIAPPHVEALRKGNSQSINYFFTLFKKYMLTQNLLYNIDVQNYRYIISDTIYPDGFTQQMFYTTIRKIFNASLYINMLLMDLIQGGGKEGKIGEDMGFGSSMYT
jgi:hypothetical protein